MSVEDYKEEIDLLGRIDFTAQSGTLGDDIANVLNEGIENFELSGELTILFNVNPIIYSRRFERRTP